MELHYHRVQLPLHQPIHAAHGVTSSRPTILLELNDESATYWAEMPAFESSSYMPETHDFCWNFLVKNGSQILEAFGSDSVTQFMQSHSNYPIFCSALDQLFYQRLAHLSDQHLFNYLGCIERPIHGAAMVGIYNDVSSYQTVLESLKKNGVGAVKLKCSPSNIRLLMDIIPNVDFDVISIDANGSFDSTNWSQLLMLPDHIWIEQPLNRSEIDLLKDMAHQRPNTILLDESIRSIRDLEMFENVPVGVMLKPVCLGGIGSTLSCLDLANDFNIPCGLSGYLESGVGRYFHWILMHHPLLKIRPDFVWSDYYFKSDVCSFNSGTVSANQFPDIERSLFVESCLLK